MSKFSEILGSRKDVLSSNRLSSSVRLDPNSIKSSLRLDSSVKSKIKFLSDDIKKSLHVKDSEFTNFLREDQIQQFKLRLASILKNPSKLADQNFDDYHVEMTDRIRAVLCSCIEYDVFSKYCDNIIKINIRDALGNMTGYRIFLYLSIEEQEYKISLIDPHHLLIPDQKTRNNKVYQNNYHNSICMSAAELD